MVEKEHKKTSLYEKIKEWVPWLIRKCSLGQFHTVFYNNDGDSQYSSLIGGMITITMTIAFLIYGYFVF